MLWAQMGKSMVLTVELKVKFFCINVTLQILLIELLKLWNLCISKNYLHLYIAMFQFYWILYYFLGCFFYINVHEVNRRRLFVLYYQFLYLFGTKRQEISSAASNLRYFSNYIQLVTVLWFYIFILFYTNINCYTY